MKKFILINISLLFFECSTVKLGYNNADWILPYMIDDYFDLNSEQESFVKEKIESHLDWHRNTELPRYSRFIEEATQKAVFSQSQTLTAHLRLGRLPVVSPLPARHCLSDKVRC